MTLETQVMDCIKDSMKAKNSRVLNALRGIKAAFLNLNNSKELIGKEITDDIRMKELQKMIKQRNESASIYKSANRTDLLLRQKDF